MTLYSYIILDKVYNLIIKVKSVNCYVKSKLKVNLK